MKDERVKNEMGGERFGLWKSRLRLWNRSDEVWKCDDGFASHYS